MMTKRKLGKEEPSKSQEKKRTTLRKSVDGFMKLNLRNTRNRFELKAKSA